VERSGQHYVGGELVIVIDCARLDCPIFLASALPTSQRSFVEDGQRGMDAVADHEFLAREEPGEEEADELENDPTCHQRFLPIR